MAEFAFPLTAGNHPVTLNSFQGPSGRWLRSLRRGNVLASERAVQHFVCEAEWTLKRVQGDGKVSRAAQRG